MSDVGRVRSCEARRSAWSPVLIELSVNSGTAGDVKQQIRAHLEADATYVALGPEHADGDNTARDAMRKAMADSVRSAGFNRQRLVARPLTHRGIVQRDVVVTELVQ
jgi:hypothetical protein